MIREVPNRRLGLSEALQLFRAQARSLADDRGISEVEDRELDGVSAKTYTYHADRDNPPVIRQQQVVAVRGSVIYTITFSDVATLFAKHQAIIERLLSSWRWR